MSRREGPARRRPRLAMTSLHADQHGPSGYLYCGRCGGERLSAAPAARGADGGQFAIGPVACVWSRLRSAGGVNTWILTNHRGAKETAPQTGLVWHATPPTIGLSVALLSMAALAAFAVWEEWLNLVAGLCLVLSPWLLGFQNSDAMALHVAMAPSTS